MNMKLRATRWGIQSLALGVLGCSRPSLPVLSPATFPFAIDSLRTQRVRDGVNHHFVYANAGPWAMHVLDVRLDRCYSAIAVKGGESATGRTKTSQLMSDLARSRDVVGGVNADFFNLTNGAPTNAHVSQGRVVTPPSQKPVFAIDSAGRPRIGMFTASVADSFAIDDPKPRAISLRPFHPLEAVGGRPVIVRDSVVDPMVDTEGQASFSKGRHPRTAIGIASDGKRLVLLVVDGRQKPYSDGMSLRELASVMLALGVRDALNLDGGGSTTLVYADPDSAGRLRIANHPSDSAGERTVGNALAIVKGCRAR